jgi:peptidoglycan/LPS O-acetylase OafA/YrhL
VAVARERLGSRAVRVVAEHPGLLWIGAAACFAGLAVVLHAGRPPNAFAPVTIERPVAETLAKLALTIGLSTLLVLPAIFGERDGGAPRRLLAAAPIAFIGLVSYGIYLWHLPIAELLGLSGHPKPLFTVSGVGLAAKIDHGAPLVIFLLTLGAATVAATVSYRLVELPFLKRKEG